MGISVKKISNIKKLAGKCGIFCGQCTGLKETIKKTAEKLKNLIESDFEWLENEEAGIKFDYKNFLKGLNWFVNDSICPGCQNIKEHWCEVMKCPEIIDDAIENCLLCDDFLECSRNEYQKKRYPFLVDHYKRVNEIGFEKHLEEEQKKAEKGLRIQDIREY
jgi:hypothetical protein